MSTRVNDSGDLFLKRIWLAKDPGSVGVYGQYEAFDTPRWTVHCRNPIYPKRTALPLSFANKADARRAMHAMVRAGLCTHQALHRRIKIERNWESVRRIMIEALMW